MGSPAISVEDWEENGLGTSDAWPQLLKSNSQLVLSSSVPMLIAWGEPLRMYFNSAFEDSLGSCWDAVLGQELKSCWGNLWPQSAAHVETALSGSPVLVENVPVSSADNPFRVKRYFSFSYTPIFDGGRVLGFLTACHETTQSVMLQEKLRLIQGDMAERNRLTAMEKVVMGLAEEVNQPLAAIGGYVWGAQRLLTSKDKDREEKLKEALAGAVSGVMRAGKIIRRQREELGKSRVETKCIDARKLVSDWSALITGQADQGIADIAVEAEAELRVLADPRQVHQVLLSVATSALEAAGHGGAKQIKISLSRPNGMVQFKIAYPAQNSTVNDPLGGGELCIRGADTLPVLDVTCKSIITAHGGQIWQEKCGRHRATCFTLLPC